MKLTLAAASAALLGAAVLTTAGGANAEILTVTFQGTVLNGTDDTGVFGVAGANLTGDRYTAVYTIDDSINAYKHYDPTVGLSEISGGTVYLPAHHGMPALGTQSPVSATITINGVTVPVPGAYYGLAWQTRPSNFGGEEYFIAQDKATSGLVTSNDYMKNQIASDKNRINPSYDFHVPFSYTIKPSDEYHDGIFQDSVCNSGTDICSVDVDINLKPTSITIAQAFLDPPPLDPPIPEPATWTMLILGVGMIGIAARRRRSEDTTFAA